MDADQHVVVVGDVAEDQREVDVSGRPLEGVGIEVPVRGG